MTTSRRALRAPTLGLAILVALPWQLAFSTFERVATAPFLYTAAPLDEPTHLIRFSRQEADPISLDLGAVLSLVAGESEEEGDDASPQPLAFPLIFHPDWANLSGLRFAPLTILVAAPPPPHCTRFRLRC